MAPQPSGNENTRLLSSSPTPPPVDRSTRPITGTETGSSASVWTVLELVHGVGEQLRGTLLGVVDDVTRSGERKHHDIARAGQAEMAGAARKLGIWPWGGSGSGSGSGTVTSYTAGPAGGYGTAPTSGLDGKP
ncbi:hypothetical protein MIND_00192300 [Mycena indigotica]|uniref:Uncharacterized protein n=1 Tax=Mycena indigotica TaxID=2126181 RepID=A0A8H6T4X6_9AGAR|nr:uncharacterized protein MIND_00192300 [Mycena indigotica]KAF7311818.1 hypothetical protein MIND_00192300 [Mycena indigotica]